MKTMRLAAMIAALMMSLVSFANVLDVSGKVIDENGNPLEFVNVVLLSLPDSTFIQGATTNEQGDVIQEWSFFQKFFAVYKNSITFATAFRKNLFLGGCKI